MKEKMNEVKNWYEKLYQNNMALFGTQPTLGVIWLAERLLPQDRILDIGAGQGRDALYLAEKGFRVTAIELSEEGCQQIKNTATQRGLNLEQCIQGDITNPDILRNLGVYNGILCINTLQFLLPEGVETTIRMMKDQTLQEGYVLVCAFVEYNRRKLKEKRKKGEYPFERNELQEMFSEFRVIYYDEHHAKRVDGKPCTVAALVAQKK